MMCAISTPCGEPGGGNEIDRGRNDRQSAIAHAGHRGAGHARAFRPTPDCSSTIHSPVPRFAGRSDHGADLVMESLTKIMSGHSDVCLGLLCGSEKCWQRVPAPCRRGDSRPALSIAGWRDAGWERWRLRVERASANAAAAAHYLAEQRQVTAVHYPRSCLASRSRLGRAAISRRVRLDRDVHARRRARGGRSIHSRRTRDSLRAFARRPEHHAIASRKHEPSRDDARGRAALGITGGTIRLSLGIESSEAVLAALAEGLAGN